MKRLALILLGLFATAPAPASAQVVPAPIGTAAMVCANNTVVPTPTDGKFFYVQCDSSGKLITSGSGSTTSPGGTPGQVQFNNAGAFGGFTVSGDGTLDTSTGALTVTKTGGTSFGPAATAARGQIPGANSNTVASSGNLGEALSSSVVIGSAVSLTTNTAANVTSIALSAGHWSCSGTAFYNPAGATITTVTNAWIDTQSSPVLPTPPAQNINRWVGSITGDSISMPVVPLQIYSNGSTTAYLSTRVTFTAGTNGAYGKLDCLRVQ